MCCKLTLPHFLSVEHCPPPPSPVYQEATYIDYVSYIYAYLGSRTTRPVDNSARGQLISDIGGLLMHGGRQYFMKLFQFWLIK